MCLQLFFQMTVIVKFYGRDTSTIQKHTQKYALLCYLRLLILLLLSSSFLQHFLVKLPCFFLLPLCFGIR